jgi:oligosaccharyl transferase complex subunit OST4
MISDSTLYSLSIFLGSLAMLLIVLYHFLEVNARDDSEPNPAVAVDRLSDEKGGVGAVKQHSRNVSASLEKAGGGGKGGNS